MPAETIWSKRTGTSVQNEDNNQYQGVLSDVDSEVARLFIGNGSTPLQDLEDGGFGRRLSFNDGSDMDGSMFGVKRGSFSAITAPVGAYPNPGPGAGGKRLNNLGTASISGGIASRHPPQDSFLLKFSAVAEATREIELSNTLRNLSLDNSGSRKTSFTGGEKPAVLNPLTEMNILASPHSSLNENLNIPLPRSSRHQSISEKIDKYNNSSPIQGSAAISVNSDLTNNTDQASAPVGANLPQNFWNPAAAPNFTPNSNSYFMDNTSSGIQAPPHMPTYGKNQNPPSFIAPAFMIPSPPPFIDPGLYGRANNTNAETGDQSMPQNPDTKKEKDGEEKLSNDMSKHFNHMGIGLMGQVPPNFGFIFPQFNPYAMYHQTPSPHVSPVGGVAQPQVDPSLTANSLDNMMESESSQVNTGQSRARSNPPTASTVKRKGGRAPPAGKSANFIYRSPLLEEVRSNFKAKEYYLKDIYGHAVEFTKDQHGSRFIQQKLPVSSDEEKEVIFNEIRDIAFELMTDVFGNYVIQKYFEHGNDVQKEVLLDCMKGHIYTLSMQMYGCRVVQRALEAIKVHQQISIIEELKDHILVCAKDQNGNHVIQKSIEKIPFKRIKFVLEALDNQIYHLSTHPYGCRVIQRLLEYSSPDDQRKILDELNRFIFYLIQDQYGNYVMQHILERGSCEDREEILKVVLGSVVNFSKHKFASNVIEKCIKYGDFEQRKRILKEVMIGNEDFNVEVVGDDSPLALMMKDQYANYVIQKLVEGFDAQSEEKKILVVKLRQYLKQISSKNNYGKHLASVEKMIIVAETALIEAENTSEE